MTRSHRFGQRAESLAAAHLARRGWRILARNWRFHHKEVDIVAERDGVVAFVEVKARSAGGWGSPYEAISAGKRRELARAARAWVAAHGRAGEMYRFDAIIVVLDRRGTVLEHVEDAWRL